MWGVWYRMFLIDLDPEAVFGGGLIRHAARSRSTAAVRVLRALSSVAPPVYAEKAAAAAIRCARSGMDDRHSPLRHTRKHVVVGGLPTF